MSCTLRIAVPAVDVAAPEVTLIDARAEGLNDAGLRTRARQMAGMQAERFSCRSYCFPLALVATHEAPVGVDIERVRGFSDAFADSICTPSERLAGWPEQEADRFLTALWSSKEALAKGLGDALQYDPRRLDGPGAWPDGCSGRWSARPLELGQDYVGWVCWRRDA
jgi:hypothetical protein